jgi:hypothetical protein
VVRKGATPAFPGQRGFVGGSMGDDAMIIEPSCDSWGCGLAPLIAYCCHTAGDALVITGENAGTMREVEPTEEEEEVPKMHGIASTPLWQTCSAAPYKGGTERNVGGLIRPVC